MDVCRKLGDSAPFLGGGLGPHRTQSPLAKAYLHISWHLDAFSRLATIEMGRKFGRRLGSVFGEGMGSHLTQIPLG